MRPGTQATKEKTMPVTLSRVWMALVLVTTMVMAGLSSPTAMGMVAPPHHTGAIAGTVTDGHGHAVADAQVTLEDGHHHVIAKTTSDQHGEFHFPHVPAGRYTVRANKPHVGHGSAVVDVHAGHTAAVHIVLR